jgi:phage baseplate assembly protein W
MSLLSFKNVGFKQYEQPQINRTTKAALPVGIKTPLEFGTNGSGFLQMHYTAEDQIRDNFRNLLLTNHGDRLMLYDYGANLQPIVTEYRNQEDFNSEAMTRINTSVAKWMPFVELEGFGSEIIYEDNQNVGKIAITVEFSVPKAQIKTKRIMVILHVI